jgi:hypothetical protein
VRSAAGAWALLAASSIGCVSPRSLGSQPEDGGGVPAVVDASAAALKDASLSGGGDRNLQPVPADGAGGACAGVTCVFENATSTCDPATGRCSAPVCKNGYGDCDGLPGCETALDRPDRCGSCDLSCRPGFACGPAHTCQCALVSCGDRCLDVARDADNCGRCDHQCVGGCSAGQCQCPAAAAGNLLVNGDFAADAHGWQVFMAQNLVTSWQAQDAAECPGSGSMVVRTINARAISDSVLQAVPVRGNTRYDFSLWMKLPQGGEVGQGAAVLSWCVRADCTGASGLIRTESFLYPTRPQQWSHITGNYLSPPNAQGAQFQISVNSSDRAVDYQVWVDMASLTPSP